MFDDHPSLDASLQDFEPEGSENGLSPRFGYPSHHSGFRSDTDSELADSLSGGGYSPPAWRREDNGHRSSGFWNKSGSVLGKHGRDSRESSPEYESADDGEAGDATLAAAARTRLPTGSLSPEKRRSPSPEPYPLGNQDFGNTFGGVVKKEEGDEQAVVLSAENPNNCMKHSPIFLQRLISMKTFDSLSEQRYNIGQSLLKLCYQS